MKIDFRKLKIIQYLMIHSFKSDYKILSIILITLCVTFTTQLLLISAIRTQINSFGDLEVLKRSYDFKIKNNRDLEDIYYVFNQLQIQPEQINDTFMGVNKSDYKGPRAFALRLSTNYDELRVQPEVSFVQGRDFTQQEIELGEAVIILDMNDYELYYKDKEIGDTITLGSKQYKLVGISQSKSLESGTMIPYEAIKSFGSQEVALRIYEIEFLLAEPLNKSEFNELINSVRDIDNDIRVISRYSNIMSNSIPYYIIYIFFMGLVSVFCIFNSLRLLISLELMNRKKRSVFNRLGMKDNSWIVSRIISIEIMVVLALLLSVGWFYTIDDVLQAWGFVAVIIRMDIALIYFLLHGISFLIMGLKRVVSKMIYNRRMDGSYLEAVNRIN